MTYDMKTSSKLKTAGSLFLLMFLILTGCEKEGVSNKEQKLFFGTVWKMDKADYYLDGVLVKSIEYNSDNALYVHYFDDLSLWISAEKGEYSSFIQTHSISDLHITLDPNIPERVVTSINQTSMVIETNGVQHEFSSERLDYDHSVFYFSSAKTNPLASSFEAEWNNYKMELYRDGKVVYTWEVDSNIKFSKDGTFTYPGQESTNDGYFLLVDDKVGFSKNFNSVMTVSINGNDMILESSSTQLGTTKNYFHKGK